MEDMEAVVEEEAAYETPLFQLVPVGPKLHIDRYGVSKNPRAANPTHEEYGRAVSNIADVHDGIQWWIGDLVNLGESLFKEEASQHIDSSRFSESTVKNCAWVASRVPDENRRVAPSWSHAQAVAALKPMEQRKWLEKARENDWSVSKLKTEILAATEGGKSKLRFILVVDCGTEAKQTKLAEQLETDGYSVVRKSATVKKERKAARKKKAKGEVTAKSRRPKKMNQTKRVPQGWAH